MAETELTIAQSVFEGLFRRALKPTGAFLEDLKRIGYDPDREQTTYPLRTWDLALGVAARHAHPTLTPDAARRRLGEQFLDGFFETITGKVISIPLGFLDVEAVLKRLPRLWESGAPGTKVSATKEGPGRWRLEVRHPSPQPEFDVGMISTGLRRTRTAVDVQLTERLPDGYVATIRWDVPK